MDKEKVKDLIGHQDWQSLLAWREKNPDDYLDLSGVNFRNYSFTHGALVKGLDFSKAKIHGVPFKDGAEVRDCLFTSAVFSSLRLENIQFKECAFDNAVFHDVEFHSVSFDLKDASCLGKSFKDCKFFNCTLNGVSFNGVSFETVVFEKSHLAEATFDRASLLGVRFSESDLSKVSFAEAGFKQSYFDGVYFKCADGVISPCEAVDFSGTTFEATTFNQSKFLKPVFSDATFNANVSFGSSLIKGATFSNLDCEKVDFDGVDFRKSDLSGTGFFRCTFKSADFFEGNLRGTRFVECSLAGTKWKHAQIDHATQIIHPLFEGHDALLDRSESIVFPRVFKFIDWHWISIIGNLPMFGISWSALAFIIFYINAIHMLNDSKFIDVIDYPIPVPDQIVLILVINVMLVIGSSIYKYRAPPRIQKFSEIEWVEVHRYPRVLYLIERISAPKWQMVAAVFLLGGAVMAVLLILYRLGLAGSYILSDAWKRSNELTLLLDSFNFQSLI